MGTCDDNQDRNLGEDITDLRFELESRKGTSHGVSEEELVLVGLFVIFILTEKGRTTLR